MSKEEKDRLDGFNAGYIIEQYRPELSQKLTTSLDGVELPFVEGFIAGSKEFAKEREQVRSRSISKLKDTIQDRIPNPSKEQDKDKGFDIER
jgi:translation elongation factor EF-Tu-like GTPase